LNYQNSGSIASIRENVQSAGELFIHFFYYYGYCFPRKKVRVDIREGKEVPKESLDEDFSYAYSVIDPIDSLINHGLRNDEAS